MFQRLYKLWPRRSTLHRASFFGWPSKFHLEMGQCLSLPESFHSWQSLSILRPASRRGLPSEDISQMKCHEALRMGADKASGSATVLDCE